MNSAAAELFGASIMSRELVKEVLKELFLEEPELLQEALQGMLDELQATLEYTNRDLAIERARISDLELLLGLDDTVHDKEDPYFDEKTERLKELRQIALFCPEVQTNSNGNETERLYEELGRSKSMKNRDILNFFGWSKKNTIKATRLMRKLATEYDDVVCEPVPGKQKSLRVYRKITP
jgi:hypothetical protein